MDKRIEKKRFFNKKTIKITGFSVGIIALIYFVKPSGGGVVEVQPHRVNVAKASIEEFNEYAPVNGQVSSEKSVFLDLEEGGIVKDIFLESGQEVKNGDLILSFSNSAVQKQIIDSESLLLENLDRLRSTKTSLTEKRLLLEESLIQLNFDMKEQQRIINANKALEEKSSGNVSYQDIESSQNRYEYLVDRRKLLLERIEQEKILRDQQSAQVDISIDRVKKSLQVLSEISDSLNVRAPADGFLSSMIAERGQSFQRGERIGQVDDFGKFVVRATVDQYFISKVTENLVGTFRFNNSTYELKVSKVYPEVKDNMFQIDMEFVGTVADDIKRGQSLQIELNLSDKSKVVSIPKGGFYQQTGGRWVYVVDEKGETARKVEIIVGKQNPRTLEIVKGLSAGDIVITSDYEKFNDAEEIVFSSPITGLATL